MRATNRGATGNADVTTVRCPNCKTTFDIGAESVKGMSATFAIDRNGRQQTGIYLR